MDKKVFDLYDEQFLSKKNSDNKLIVSDDELKQFNELKHASERLNKLSSVTINEQYFSTIIPRLREKQTKQRFQFSFKKLVYTSAVAFSTVIVMFYSFAYVQQAGSAQQENYSAANISPYTEDSYVVSSDQFSDSIVNDKNIEQEIDKTLALSLSWANTEASSALIKNENDYENVISLLDAETLEQVYAELQNTKIL